MYVLKVLDTLKINTMNLIPVITIRVMVCDED